MEIYLDVLLLENFIVDLVLLLITAKILSLKICTKRLLIASLIGSLYTLTLVFKNLYFLSKVPFQIAVSYLIVSIIVSKAGIKTKLKGTGIFLLSSIMLSGLCYGLSLWMGSDDDLTSRTNSVNTSVKIIVLSISILFLITDRTINYVRERIATSTFMYDVEITIDGMKYIIKGFLDTGNSLREPITNLPCIIVQDSVISLDEGTKEYYIVPYKAVGHNGVLKGFISSSTRIKAIKDGRWKEIEKIIVCPCREKLSTSNDFNALLSIGIL